MADSQITTLIKFYAKSKGITLKEISKKIGITEQGLYTSFQHNSIKVSTLQKIADVLEIDIREFFGGKRIDDGLSFIISEMVNFILLNTYYKELIDDFVKTSDFYTLQNSIARHIKTHKPYKHDYYIPYNSEVVIKIINKSLFQHPSIKDAFEKKKVKNSILQAQYEEWKKNPPVLPEEKED